MMISLIPPRSYALLVLVLLAVWIILLTPTTDVFADSNVPTVTNSPVPTDTPIPDTPTQEPPTETPYPYPPDDQNNIQMATVVPPPPSEPSGGLSTLNRFLLVCLSVVTVLVVGMIVYLVFNQTRGGGLGDRF